MNRQERRSIEALEKKVFKQLAKLKTPEAIVLKARQFVMDDEQYDIGLAELLERPDFDAVFVSTLADLDKVVIDLNVAEFYADLMSCAHERVDIVGENVVRYSLFALAISGPSDAVSDVAKGENPTRIAKTFRAAGLAKNSDSIFVLPHLLHDGDVASLTPGMLNGIVSEVAAFAATNAGSLADVIDGIIETPMLEDDDPDKFASRMLLGVHMQIVGDDPEEMAGTLLGCESNEILERWQALADAVVGPTVSMHLPTDVAEAGTLMSLDRITMAIDMEARTLGCRVDRRYDEMRVWRGEENLIWVSAKIGGKSVGPVDCPAPLALGSPQLFFSHLADISEKLLDEPEPSPIGLPN